jgi:concentrative nucleoside transporter, CNT family
MNLLWGIGGIAALIAIAFAASKHRKVINWRTVLVGLALQLGFAFLVLKSSIGKTALMKLAEGVNTLMGYTNEGINFVLGGIFQAENIGHIFAFQVLPTIIFFSSLIAVLYYLGIMQLFIKVIGGGLSKLLGTSKTESLSAAANIFVGQTEAPLVIKPYLAKMTQSQLFAVMVGGLTSVAGSVLVGYSMLGIPLEYLLAASFMAAPAGLVMAKLFIPETETFDDSNVIMEKDDSVNIFDAAARGASDGMRLAVNVGAMLLAFVALVAMLNGMIGGIGSVFGFEGLSMETILGYIFAPLAFVIGVPWSEAVTAAGFIGQKLVLNEFVAFSNLGPIMETLSPKTAMITSFALTGFANFSCIAILLGGIGAMAPSRRKDIARLGVRAVAAATLANLLSAAIAGMFM